MRKTSNGLFWVIGGMIYIGLIILFAWQTWQLVNFLFPQDQLTAKILTLLSFDVMAVVWGCMDLFYSFASRGAKMLVRVAWIITFLLSLIASILYLSIQWFFRFALVPSQEMVTWGYIISLFALTLDILCLMFWIYWEYNARNPHQDAFEHYESLRERRSPTVVSHAQQASLPQTASIDHDTSKNLLRPASRRRK